MRRTRCAAAIGLLLYGGILFVVAVVSRGMGMGDVKLAALIGLVFGSLGLRFVGVAAGAAIVFGGLGGVVALAMGQGAEERDPVRALSGGGGGGGGTLGRADRLLVHRPLPLTRLEPLPDALGAVSAELRIARRSRCLTSLVAWCFVSTPKEAGVLQSTQCC